MAKQKRRRRLRVGRLLALLLAAVLSIGVFAVFVSGMIHIVQEIISPQETPAVQSEPTPTPDPTYRHSYDWQNLKEDEAGFLSYEDSAYRTRLGIDVSHYQGTIDWHAVHDAGVVQTWTQVLKKRSFLALIWVVGALIVAGLAVLVSAMINWQR